MKRIVPTIRLFLVLAMLAFIWGHSLMPAEVSSQESEWFLRLVKPAVMAADWCLRQLGVRVEPSALVRKMAHFGEYAVLGALMYLLFSLPKKRRRGLLAAAGCLAAALIDEFLQRFAAGRAPALRDVGIDFAGACLGIALAAAVPALIHLAARKRRGNT